MLAPVFLPQVNPRTLLSYIGPRGLPFCDMATKWMGYQPKGGDEFVETLIRGARPPARLA